MELTEAFMMRWVVIIGFVFSNVWAQVTYTWTGSVDNSWHKPCNWSPNGVPTCLDNVIIPGGTPNNPVITGVAGCATITIQSTNGAQLTIYVDSGGILQVGNCPLPITTKNCPNTGICKQITASGTSIRRIGSIVLDTAQNIIMGGFSSPSNDNSYIAKLQSDFTFLWGKEVDYNFVNERVIKVVVSDSAYYLLSRTWGTIAPMITKVDWNGTVLWSAVYQSPDDITPESMVGYNNKLYIVASMSGTLTSCIVFVIDAADGTVLWSKRVSNNNYDLEPRDITLTPQKKLLIVGRSENQSGTPIDPATWLFEMDTSGAFSSSKEIQLQAASVLETALKVFAYGNYYLLLGSTNEGSGVLNNPFIVKMVASSAAVVWAKYLDRGGTGGNVLDAYIAYDSSFVIIAGSDRIFKVDSTGNLVWNKQFNSNFSAYALAEMSNGDIIVGGQDNNLPSVATFTLLNSDGTSTCLSNCATSDAPETLMDITSPTVNPLTTLMVSNYNFTKQNVGVSQSAGTLTDYCP